MTLQFKNKISNINTPINTLNYKHNRARVLYFLTDLSFSFNNIVIEGFLNVTKSYQSEHDYEGKWPLTFISMFTGLLNLH